MDINKDTETKEAVEDNSGDANTMQQIQVVAADMDGKTMGGRSLTQIHNSHSYRRM